ncbi:MAG: TAT-variant-translocated molybdopterin oxidoreductase [Cytophagaceae bacterium]|nr:TAT-variant-translocated molybdopterin oxidoreductase [Cytophagaceae bacterium]
MENTNKRYWKGVEELKNDIELVKNSEREFNLEGLESGTYRRDFLKMLGFGVAAVSLAACDAPVRKSIPYLNKPEDVEPGIPNYYASSYNVGGNYASVLVKTREGRPIKIEGNKLSGVTKGGVNAQVHASVLSLYDSQKLKDPKKEGKKTTWEELDKDISNALATSQNVRIVSNTILSPTTKAVIADFAKKYPSTKHITYDANSASGLIEANASSFGKAVIPSFLFNKANVIVGVNCDFLGTWISPIEYSALWAEGRKVSSAKGGKKSMSRHYQFETGMTITGANADYRGAIKPSQEGLFLANLFNKLVGILGAGTALSVAKFDSQYLDKCAKDLTAAKGAGLVVSGSNDVAVQTLVNGINSLLGNVGNTIDFGTTVNYRQGSDAQLTQFASELKSGVVDAVIFLGANPVYDTLKGTDIAEGLKKAKLSVSISETETETAKLCKFIATSTHFLESWGDANPKTGFYSLIQPCISNIFNSRQAESSLLTWAGQSSDFHAYLKSNWKANILGGVSWTKALHDGVLESPLSVVSGANFTGNLAGAVASLKSGKGIELSVFESVTVGTGIQANNPWLLETPDPITKVTWENTASVSQKTAADLGLTAGDWVNVTVGKVTKELPLVIQPGQANDTVSIAMGFGRTSAGKAGNTGTEVLSFLAGAPSASNLWVGDVKIEKTKSGYTLPQTQTHETYMGREAVVQETILSKYVKDVKAGRYEPKISTSEGLQRPYSISMWNGHSKKNHSWGMVIDLNTCTGCSACLVSCQAENNVPVVGKVEVARAREMHWIRIDRYYSSDAPHEQGYSVGGFKAMEIASENPEVVFQPMMCQHCSNAPCETVCPVLATTHSSEGLNQMTYNRCVGTRYCANNCPYKVRRFNWFKYFENDNFDYNLNNDLGKMVLNPDVTIRSRGVIEKCSMCVQRIQAGKLTAKSEKRRPFDGEIETACSQSCPTGAIVFGDMLDPNTKISKLLTEEAEGRAYHVLEELNVIPQISYLSKVRNKDEQKSSDTVASVKHTEEHAH